jgi:primosomal protein N' (replication factor Y)
MNALDSEPPPVIARVEPLTTTRAIRGPFDYRLAADQDGVEVGSLLRVPFGSRTTLGVVTGLAQSSDVDPERLVEPEAVLPGAIPGDLVALASWMAREYCSTPARALSLVLAPGAGRAPVRPRRVLTAEITDDGRAALGGAAKLTAHQRAALEALAERGPTRAAALGTETLRRLERRGLVVVNESARLRADELGVGARTPEPPPLTAAQARALEPVERALAAREHRGFLLHGVTGSGKTEVYLRAVQATLAAGGTAIVLVPEIALTPQVVGRFRARFGEVVAVLHSALSAGERHQEWMALRTGQARVCVGPRSAVFAPLENVGLIVVDEEHDGSYKHEGDPRYDARTVAMQRSIQHDAVVIAGSATPRPESVVALTRLRLPERIDHRPLPPVEVLDMRGHHHPLHPRTRIALSDVRRAGGKAIVLLNRRGWSNFLSCRACGQVWMCPNCDVALVLHRSGGFVACHHCGHRARVPSRCGACGSVALARHGAGTERLEEELREALGEGSFPVFRLDADAGGRDRLAEVLRNFEAAPAGVLVGTQMVAKGHDFPDVTLGVVMDADQTLRFPDFRAEERTFALVTQLAGRAGRGAAGGTVLVQTLAPSARSIEFAARHDSDGFLADELARREALRYPPFGTLIRVVCSAVEAEGARAAARALRDATAAAGALILGPAPLFRLRGRAREQLVVKAADRAAAIAAVGEAVARVAPGVAQSGVSVSVDVDPQ